MAKTTNWKKLKKEEQKVEVTSTTYEECKQRFEKEYREKDKEEKRSAR